MTGIMVDITIENMITSTIITIGMMIVCVETIAVAVIGPTIIGHVLHVSPLPPRGVKVLVRNHQKNTDLDSPVGRTPLAIMMQVSPNHPQKSLSTRKTSNRNAQCGNCLRALCIH